MTPRISMRLTITVLGIMWLFAAVLYFVNPLGTPSYDPRLRLLGFTLFRMPSTSMEPTIHLNTVFFVSAWEYRDADPAPGDVVVFQWPRDTSVFFAKRVIATGGSTVAIVEGVTIVDGRPIREPYLDRTTPRNPLSLQMQPVHIPANNFFVMGDNRDNSDDSRSWGFVPRNRIVGKVQLRRAP
jgi:signal peptidase I